MTIEEAIKYIDVGWPDGSGGIYIGREYSWQYKEAVNVAISALRAQQEAEKNEPCDFCGKYNFANARTEVNKYGAYISLAGGLTQFPVKDQFNFCPVCGRPLKRRWAKEAHNV